MDKQDIVSDFVVPLAQAAVSGWIVAVGAALVAQLVGWPVGPVMGLAGLVTTAGVWFNLLGDRRPALPELPEAPQQAVTVHKLEFTVKAEGGAVTRLVELPEGIDAATMRQLARALQLQGGTFSRPYLCRHKRLLTQNQYHDLRRAWLRAGLVAALPGNRTELTAAGRAVLHSFGK